MSASSNIRFKECKVTLTRMTMREINSLSGKHKTETKKIADLTTDIKPKLFVRKDIETDKMDNKTTQDTEDTSKTGHEIIPDIIEPQIIQNESINNEEINETQDTEDTSNTGHEIIPDIIEPQIIQNESINNEEINDTQADENVFQGFEDLFPDMIHEQYVQNNMDTSGTIDNQQICDIPNVMTIKQEIQEDYETYMPQVSSGTSQIMIKQEVIDESYNYNMYSTQDSNNMYSEYTLPIIPDQPAQDFGMQSISTETSNPHIFIKQEIFDEGNIEVYTDVLRPSADQGYEDGSPW